MAPVDPELVEIGDIVLTRVSGRVYVHLAWMHSLSPREGFWAGDRARGSWDRQGPGKEAWLIKGFG